MRTKSEKKENIVKFCIITYEISILSMRTVTQDKRKIEASQVDFKH